MSHVSAFSKIFLLLACFCSGPVMAMDGSSKDLSKKPKEEVILIQTAASGSIEKDKTNQNLYKITLQKVMPYLSYVSDRPNRNVGKITLEKYLKLWVPRDQNSFHNNPPNAIIHVNSHEKAEPGKPQYFALEISAPKYDAGSETLVYQGKPLVGDGLNLPEAATFHQMTLIIDDVCIGCWD